MNFNNLHLFIDSSDDALAIRKVETTYSITDTGSIQIFYNPEKKDTISEALSDANIPLHSVKMDSLTIKGNSTHLRRALNTLSHAGLIHSTFARQISENFLGELNRIHALNEARDDELTDRSPRDIVLSLAAPFSSASGHRDPEQDSIFSHLRDRALRLPDRHFELSDLSDYFVNFRMLPSAFSHQRELSFGEHPFFSPTRHVSYPSLAQAQFPTGVTSGNNAKKIENITNFPTDTIPAEYICPLSLSIMSDPAYIQGDVTGQRFERSWIIAWLNEKGSHPTTRVKFRSGLLQLDVELKQAINHFIQAAEIASIHHDEKPTSFDASVEPIIEEERVGTMDAYIPEPMRLMRDIHFPIRHQTLTNEDEALSLADIAIVSCMLPGYR